MNLRVIGLGEVLWDLLPAGPQLGGAPANFAYHAHALGGCAGVVTRIGNDRLGQEILERFKAMELPEDLVQVDPQAPTGTVSVNLSGNGVPQFTIHQHVAWDQLEVTDKALEAVGQADAICFGSLAQRTPGARAAIQRLVATAPTDALRVFDINLRQHFYSREVIAESLQLANVLKLNDGELPSLTQMFELGKTQHEQVEQLGKKFDLGLVALTLGAQGSLLYQEGRWSTQPPQPAAVVDTVGAGDAFTAGMVMGLLLRRDLDRVHADAAEVARYVCSCAGATPALPRYLRDLFEEP